jgi:hypothetical protein
MYANSHLKSRLEAAAKLDATLMRAVVDALPCLRTSGWPDQGADAAYDTVFQWAETVHHGFLYLSWRSTDARHHCSISLEEEDLDRHRWLGKRASPALALAAALVSSLDLMADRRAC